MYKLAPIVNTPMGVYFGYLIKTSNSENYILSGNSVGSCRDSLCTALIKAKNQSKLLIDDKATLLVGAKELTSKEKRSSLLKLIHFVEKQLNVKTKTRIYVTNHKNYFVFRMDPYWVRRTYFLSLYSLFVRIGVYSFSSEKETPEAFLKRYRSDYWGYDIVRNNYKFLVENGPYLTPQFGDSYLGILNVKMTK